MIKPKHYILVLILVSQGFSTPGQMGYNDLLIRLNGDVPTGTNVKITQVEALDQNGYVPNSQNNDLSGINFILKSGPSGNSGHATQVARRAYGRGIFSIIPQMPEAYLYSASGWLQNDFLNLNTNNFQLPLAIDPGCKVINHSWVGSFGNTSLDQLALRRADFVIDRDNVVMTVGVNNGSDSLNQPLMCYGHSVLSIGTVDGNHAYGIVPPPFDDSGRMIPQLVAPETTSSDAAGLATAATGLIFDTILSNPTLAQIPEIQKGEVVRAVLLSGALPTPSWTNNPILSGSDAGITSTPLDPIFGAGLIHIDRSHKIITGERINGSLSIQNASYMTPYGWELSNPEPNSSLWWKFRIDDNILEDDISIAATWNRFVSSSFNSALNFNIDLNLWILDQNDYVRLIGKSMINNVQNGNTSSKSTVDVLELLQIESLSPGEYLLEMERVDFFTIPMEVGLGWRIPNASIAQNPSSGDFNSDGAINVLDLLSIISAFGECASCPQDLNSNGIVDTLDLLILISNFD